MIDWRGKRVVIVGAARQGTALARYLVLQGARVVLNDRCSEIELVGKTRNLFDSIEQALGSLELVYGGHPVNLLDGADLLCLSGGVPPSLPLVKEALARGIPLSNDSQIFLEAAPCPVVGITGSAGKTTTTTLVGLMAEAASIEVDGEWKPFVGGNIGSPLIINVAEMRPQDLAIMELSSFQLEIMTRSPHIAVILNITPNHLDRHASMEEYTAAKARILDFQERADAAVLSREDPGSRNLFERVRGRLFTFGVQAPDPDEVGTFKEDGRIYLMEGQKKTQIMPCKAVRLRGQHNLLNVLAACAIGAAAGFSPTAMRKGVEGFEGVTHRLEYVRTWKGTAWYNDSIATAPERSIAAIRSFTEPLILLAGGRDKNLPWDEFAELVRERVDRLVLFGEAAEKIAEAVIPAGETAGTMRAGSSWVKEDTSEELPRPYSLTLCSGLEDAIQVAARFALPGHVVLFSPGGTSFDEFRDFEERGEAFRKWVMELH
jgi:UDP-N-acetylmuramoylalanine--D-glutamate ligase